MIYDLNLYSDQTIRVFIVGDYDFLTKVYGLSGASGKRLFIVMNIIINTGKHFCLFCYKTLDDLKLPPVSSAARTLEALMLNSSRFLADGGKLKKAKEYNNCIARPIFHIPLDQVN